MSVQPSIIAKVSVKSIGCNPKAVAALEETDRREILLSRIIGIVSGVTQGETENGEYFAFTGRFQASNEQEGTTTFGTTYESGVCYLPSGIHESILATVTKLGLVKLSAEDKRTDKVRHAIKDGQEVRFALDIAVKRDSNASGITYVGRPILEPTTEDPLAEIRKAIAATEANLQAALNAASGNGADQKQLPAVEAAVSAAVSVASSKKR